ncbi:MAG: hypothetical protein Ct9H300mP28_11420 [Pseudomonadota bacterium]|nr:MAG: hypothetical protein Ct9H300mP28_11420 [Pseudomonadota bacterium]
MTNDEALEISNLIQQRVKENLDAPKPSEVNLINSYPKLEK